MSWKRLAAYAAIYIIWGGSFLAIREVVRVAPPFLMAAVRFFTAGILLLGYARLRGVSWPTREQWRSTAKLGLFMFAANYGCLFWAEQRVASGLAAIFSATIPVWIFAFEWLFLRTQRLRFLTCAGLAGGVLGVALLVGGPGSMSAEVSVTSAAVLLVGAVFWAGCTVWSRRLKLPESQMMSAALQMTWGGIFLFIVSAAAGEFGRTHISAPLWSVRVIVGMLYLIVAASSVAFTAYVWLLQTDSPTRVGSYAYVNPIVAVLLGVSFAGEHFTASEAIGAALVVVGVIATLRGKQAPQSRVIASESSQTA